MRMRAASMGGLSILLMVHATSVLESQDTHLTWYQSTMFNTSTRVNSDNHMIWKWCSQIFHYNQKIWWYDVSLQLPFQISMPFHKRAIHPSPFCVTISLLLNLVAAESNILKSQDRSIEGTCASIHLHASVECFFLQTNLMLFDTLGINDLFMWV